MYKESGVNMLPMLSMAFVQASRHSQDVLQNRASVHPPSNSSIGAMFRQFRSSESDLTIPDPYCLANRFGGHGCAAESVCFSGDCLCNEPSV
jgi:hypothetical protein